MYGRCECPFFGGVCFSSRKTIDALECMELAHIIQCIGVMQDLLHILRTCARSINTAMLTL